MWTKSTPGETVPTTRVELVCRHLPGNMLIANSHHGRPTSTHVKGGVLDLILTGDGVRVQDLTVAAPGAGLSDHAMVTARLGIAAKPLAQEQLCVGTWRGMPGGPSSATSFASR